MLVDAVLLSNTIANNDTRAQQGFHFGCTGHSVASDVLEGGGGARINGAKSSTFKTNNKHIT